MDEEKERYVLFLHDPSVEPDNNLVKDALVNLNEKHPRSCASEARMA